MFGKKKLIQEFQKKEAKWQKKLAEAEKLADEQSELAAQELRTPLVKLQRILQESLKDPSNNVALTKAINMTLEEINQYKRLIDDIFIITRTNLYKEANLFVPINLTEATQEVCDQFKKQAQNKGLELTVNLEPNITFPAHPTYFRKMISLLLDNAVKYTEQGHILVSLKRVKNELILIIEDSGTGMEHEQVSKAFKRFYRLEKSRKESVSGHGLGLSLAQWIARLHGTDLEVTSMTDKGTTLVVRFSLKNLM